MSVAKVIELYSTSDKGFEDAVQKGIAKASETIKNIRGAWVAEQKVDIENGKIVRYRVSLKLTFVLE